VRDIPGVGCNLRSFLAYFREICRSTLREGVFALVVDVHERHSDSVSSSRQKLFHEDCCVPAIISALSEENDRQQGLQNPIVRIAQTSISRSMLQVRLVIVVTKWKITMTPEQTIRQHSVRRTHTRFNSHHDIRICFQYQFFLILKVNSIQMKSSSFLNCFYSTLPIRILISLLLEDIFLHSKFFSEKQCLVL